MSLQNPIRSAAQHLYIVPVKKNVSSCHFFSLSLFCTPSASARHKANPIIYVYM